MRFMGWSYPELLACPRSYLNVLNEMVEAEERARLARELESRAARR